jgi:hypothetical protein
MKNTQTISKIVAECVEVAIGQPCHHVYNDRNKNDRRITVIYCDRDIKWHPNNGELIKYALKDILTWMHPKRLKFRIYFYRNWIRVQLRLTFPQCDKIASNSAIPKRLEHERIIQKIMR